MKLKPFYEAQITKAKETLNSRPYDDVAKHKYKEAELDLDMYIKEVKEYESLRSNLYPGRTRS